MTKTLTNDVIAHLEAERHAIVTGAFEVLAEMTTTKVQLLDRIETERPPPAQLKEINRHAVRNEALLAAALRGVQSVAERISSVREVQRRFDSYTHEGTRQSHPIARPAFERKA